MQYLGLDFGLKRIGLAKSFGQFASPWKTIEGKGVLDLVQKICQVVSDSDFDKLVVGLPEGPMGRTVNQFVNLLKKNGLDVVVTDETLSTQKAQRLLIEMGLPKKKRHYVDAHAAAEILQSYLDERAG